VAPIIGEDDQIMFFLRDKGTDETAAGEELK
jgi:hypothetical protein